MAQTAPIFKPLKSKFKPLGVPIGRFAGIVATCLAGLLLAYLLGGVQIPYTAAYTQAERQQMLNEMYDAQKGLKVAEMAMEEQGADSLEATNLKDSTRDSVELCQRLGITSATTGEQLIAMTPTRHQVKLTLGTLWERVALLVGLPAIVGFGLFIEIRGTSLYSELTRMFAWRRSQKLYRNLPMTYAERKCGKPYAEVVADAARAERKG